MRFRNNKATKSNLIDVTLHKRCKDKPQLGVKTPGILKVLGKIHFAQNTNNSRIMIIFPLKDKRFLPSFQISAKPTTMKTLLIKSMK